jgi:predicted secreted protein with PEFG-CTERM motif
MDAMVIVVPEFGTIAMMGLAVEIINIVAVTAKDRIIPRFWEIPIFLLQNQLLNYRKELL